jgi:hypothetical protein
VGGWVIQAAVTTTSIAALHVNDDGARQGWQRQAGAADYSNRLRAKRIKPFQLTASTRMMLPP